MDATSSRSRRCRLVAALLALAAGIAVPLSAQTQAPAFPSKPVRIVVPFTPGGSPDVQARLLADKLQAKWGQPVVVENRPGASGNIGADAVARSAPDGHTLLMAVSNAMTVNPVLTKMPLDVQRDLAAIGMTARVHFMLVTHPSVPAKDAAELIRVVRAQPGRLNYGSSGDGSTQHLATELLSSMAGLSMVHVPYKGAAPALTDLIGGQIQVWIGAANSLMPHVREGKLRALAVAGKDRLALMPELPTMAESGLPTYDYSVWLGLAAPAGTDPAVVARIHADVAQVLADAEVQARLREQGIEPVTGSPQEMAQRIRAETALWTELLRADRVRAAK